MFKNIAKALGADPQKKELDRLTVEVEKITRFEKPFEVLSDQDLRFKTDEFRRRLTGGETLDDILPEAFAAVREASKRTTGLRHFDIQLIGGMVLHEGRIAEMRTGEGKTLVATLPLYLNALTGKGTHLVTVNDYLARRDARWMAPIYHMLGLSVGVLQMSERTDHARNAFLVDLDARSPQEEDDQLRIVPRQSAYQADITYGTNNEFGFDYLRDNLVMDIHNRVQRGHHYAIIDEVDNILIDEARTPLIISGPASEDVAWYSRMAAVVRQLEPEDYDFDEKDRSIALTEVGEAHVEELLQVPLRDPDRPEDITPEQARLLGHLEQALKALLLFKRNKDYILQNGQIVIVDEFTGRLMPGRRWSEGLHQAVEAKEGVKVNPENVTHATITLQNYFRKYEKLAGMTGTALTEAEEFSTIYKLDVIVIPTNLDFESSRPDSDLVTLQAKDPEGYPFTYYILKEDPQRIPVFWKRKDYPDVVYRTEEAKLRAITLEILNYHLIGRPQLVGTTSIEHSERLSSRLQSDMLRRLLMTVLIREYWMEAHNIQTLDRAIPELEQLNQPLENLSPSELRQFAHSLGIQAVNPESEENLEQIRKFLELDVSCLTRLVNVVQGGIPNQVLNALRHDQESRIIAGAGAFGAVTIATNMAGRGVDIKLGGEIGEAILSDVRHLISESDTDPYGMTNAQLAETLQHINLDSASGYAESVQRFLSFYEETRRVRELGGLHVIGSERHEARRIDNQLRGRSARQGDPGSSRFYLSLEDELMRMFGGERAETLMRIFNIDASIPLESNMLGRLVEQAQERVEGYNFDIRKHLLDYDDVLNAQRERIYAERDRALTKENLEEDVMDMLHSEMRRRIQEGMADAEGPWKLLAYLDEIQPTIFYPQQQARITSYTLKLIAAILKELIKDISDDNAVTAGALELARQALEAERDHIISSTQAFIQRTASSYEQQLTERLDMLDIFLDAMDEQAPASPRELASQLQEQVHLRIQLDADILDGIRENKRTGKDQIQALVAQGLMQIFLLRLIMAIERRLSEPLGIKADQLEGLDWEEIENRISDSILDLFNSRVEKLTDADSEIPRNIQVIIRRQREASQKTVDLYELAAGMSMGTRMAIDARTHQKGFRQVHLLNYVFLAAQHQDSKNPEQAAGDILNHLDDVQSRLKGIWGSLELSRISENAITVQDLPLQYQYAIKQAVGSDFFQEVASVPLEKLKSTDDLNLPDLLGGMVQQAIYKHILLSAISELWIDHLTRMEALRVSIRMEAYAQRDPLVLYKNESTETFKNLLSEIRMGVISRMFRVQPAKPKAAQPDDETKPQQEEPADSGTKVAKTKRKRHKKR